MLINWILAFLFILGMMLLPSASSFRTGHLIQHTLLVLLRHLINAMSSILLMSRHPLLVLSGEVVLSRSRNLRNKLLMNRLFLRRLLLETLLLAHHTAPLVSKSIARVNGRLQVGFVSETRPLFLCNSLLVAHHVSLVDYVRIWIVILIWLSFLVFINISKVIIFEIVFLPILLRCIVPLGLLLPILNRIGRH